MIDCKVCGHQIAPDAKRCPNCGGVTSRVRSNRRALFWAVAVSLVALALLYWYLNSSLSDAPTRLQAP